MMALRIILNRVASEGFREDIDVRTTRQKGGFFCLS